MKLQQYERMKMKPMNPNEYLQQFLEAEVRALWPPGWMTTRCGIFRLIFNVVPILMLSSLLNNGQLCWVLVGLQKENDLSPKKGLVEHLLMSRHKYKL